MKSSFYNIFFNIEDKYYIYNTLSTSILAVPQDVISHLKSNSIDNIDEHGLEILKKNGMVVKFDTNEGAIYEHYYNSIQYCSNPEELRLVILPTYNCNLQCSYCFENCNTTKSHLTDDDISEIIAFVENELSLPYRAYKRILLILFGGEPLLYKNVCIELTSKISKIANEKSLNFTSKIITNATLINQDIITNLIIPNNMRIQITLDGNKDVHDSRRRYKSGNGSYDKINEVIHLLNNNGCKDLIDLRLNIDKDNLDCVEDVFNGFHSLCGYLYVGLLRAAGNNSCRTNECITDNDYHINIRPKFKPFFKKYKKELHNIAFGKKRPCAMNRIGCYVIDPELYVYKCENLVGEAAYSVGRIQNGFIKRNSQYYEQLSWSPFRSELCKRCKLLPACASDCAYRCLKHTGSMQNTHCAMTEQELIERVKLYIADNASDK